MDSLVRYSLQKIHSRRDIPGKEKVIVSFPSDNICFNRRPFTSYRFNLWEFSGK